MNATTRKARTSAAKSARSSTKARRTSAKKQPASTQTAGPKLAPTELGFLGMLALVLSSEPLVIIEPTSKMEEGFVKRGVIASDLARRLYTIYSMLHAKYLKMRAEHKDLHLKSAAIFADHNCEEFHAQLNAVGQMKELFFELFSMAVVAEHSDAGVNEGAHFGAGWVFSSPGTTEWKKAERTDQAELVRSMFSKLTDVMVNRKVLGISPDDLPDVQEGSDVVGVTDHPVIKGLFGLHNFLFEEGREGIPPHARVSEASWLEWQGDQRVSDLKHFKARMAYSDVLHMLVAKIVSQALKELYPQFADRALLVCKGWVVVVPPEPEMIEIDLFGGESPLKSPIGAMLARLLMKHMR
jgi:hypothetical protein